MISSVRLCLCALPHTGLQEVLTGLVGVAYRSGAASSLGKAAGGKGSASLGKLDPLHRYLHLKILGGRAFVSQLIEEEVGGRVDGW